ncbi:MAG: DUF2079 domain-containing protein [Ruminococcaceae bacterium]|nr:DUF2079 domain-containing protein [Oscillospiraceae bacterium]
MGTRIQRNVNTSVALFLRRLILAWFLAVAAEYLRLPAQGRDLAGLQGLRLMSLGRVLGLTAGFWLLLTLLSRFVRRKLAERLLLAGVIVVVVAVSVVSSFHWAYLMLGLLLVAAAVVYGLWGWNSRPIPEMTPERGKTRWALVTQGLTVCFFLLVSIWTVCRVRSFSAPTYDFGIFSQMFYHMKTTGLPLTTVERDGLMSHFAVHVSPVYYLLLPLYALLPIPETLQVLQAAVMASAVVPLWKLGKLHGLKDGQRMLLCALLLLYPAFSGGAGYDIHENCFLTPLLLWLFYGMDKGNGWITGISAGLTLLVKEDAAVYVAVAGLYLLLRTLLHRGKRRDLWTAVALLMGAVLWFALVTGYLSSRGDGVMTYRYDNFIYDNSGSLLTVIGAVVMCPMKMLYEAVDPEKLSFIGLTMLPLLGLPLLTRRYERYLLLIPYILVNLMPDYRYQHDIFFQYTFGSVAFLLYLTMVNLRDIRCGRVRLVAMLLAVAVSAGAFGTMVMPKVQRYAALCQDYGAHYDRLRDTLNLIPEDAPVSATTFYTTCLSQREVLYDVRYATWEHLLTTDYIALAVKEENSYKAYGGYDNLVERLEQAGYTLFAQMEGTLTIYYRPPSP